MNVATTFSIATLKQMTFSITTFRIMALRKTDTVKVVTNYIQYNDTKLTTFRVTELSIMTLGVSAFRIMRLSIMTIGPMAFSITTLSITTMSIMTVDTPTLTGHYDIGHNDNRHFDTHYNSIYINKTQQNKKLHHSASCVIIHSSINAECHYVECRYAECCTSPKYSNVKKCVVPFSNVASHFLA